MVARVTSRSGSTITIETVIDINGSMLTAEESILTAVNEVGAVATGEALRRFDADGGPIKVGGVKWYSNHPKEKFYQTPFGEIGVERRVYQRAEGGQTFCPMEMGARTMRNATPRFAKMVAHKLAHGTAADVKFDLEQNHGRVISKLLAQELSAFVSAVVHAKEELWSYSIPKMNVEISTIGIGIDGTCTLLFGKRWQEAMTGSISLYDNMGAHQHTIFVGTAVESGNESFFIRMEKEIAHVKQLYPTAHYVGIVDGIKATSDFLRMHVQEQIVDFHHVSTYLIQAAEAIFEREHESGVAWLSERSALLKNDLRGAQIILDELGAYDSQIWKDERRKNILECIQFFKDHGMQMQYAKHQATGMPISSGMIEAACLTLIKRRLSKHGMRWKGNGAQMILSLRALLLTETRWGQFWQKIEQFGVPELES
jgi:hypothetical protein